MPPHESGTVSDGALAAILGRLQREKGSGRLRLRAMQLRGGVPVVLRRALRLAGGRLSALEVEDGERAAPPSPGPDPDLAERVAEVVAHLLACPDGFYTWEPEASPGGAAAGPWLAEAARPALEDLYDPGLVRTALGPLERTISATPAGAALVGQLTPGQSALLGRAAGGPTAADLCGHASDPDAAARDLLLLIGLGLVSWASEAPPATARPAAATEEARPPAAPPPAPPAPPRETVADRRREIERAHAALRGANHFQVLGLVAGASTADVRKAFASLARRFHPDALADPGLADLRPKLMDLFVAVGKAHDALKDPAARDRYERALGLGDRPPVRPSARSAPAPASADEPIEARILRAEEALAAAQPWEAIRLLEEAIGAASGPLKARARVLLGRAYVERDKPREAEKVLQAALKDDPRSAAACLALGRLYRDRGMAKRARGMFEKALAIDPRLPDARRELAALGDDPSGPDEGGSLLSRLRDRR